MLLSSLDEAEYDEDQSDRELLLPPARKALLADILSTDCTRTDGRTDHPAKEQALMMDMDLMTVVQPLERWWSGTDGTEHGRKEGRTDGNERRILGRMDSIYEMVGCSGRPC